MEDYAGLAALIKNYSVSQPLVNEKNLLPQQLYTHNEVCKCLTVYEFLDKALTTETGSTLISWMGKEPLPLRDGKKHRIVRTCDKAVVQCDGNFVCGSCFCHGTFRYRYDYFFVDGERCTDLQWNSIKRGDRINIGFQESDSKSYLYAWVGQPPLIKHELNLDFYFEGDARDTTGPNFGTKPLQGEVVALLQPNTALLSIMFETMQVLAILFSKVSMSRDGSVFEDVLRIGDIVNVQFEKIEGFKMWFIVNAWMNCSSASSGVPFTLVNRQDNISSEPIGTSTNLINEFEIEDKCLENCDTPLSDGGSADDDYVICSHGGEEGQLLYFMEPKKKCTSNAVILCQGKKVLLNWKNLFINEEQCKHTEFSSALTENGQVLKVEAVPRKVLGKLNFGEIKFDATCAWFGQKPSLEKMINSDSSELSHLLGKRVSGQVVKIVLPYVAIISVQDKTKTVYAVLFTSALKTSRNGLKVKEGVFMSTYLHVGDVVHMTLRTELGKEHVLSAVQAECEAGLKISGTSYNDHVTTLSSETSTRNNDEECLNSAQCLESESRIVDSSVSVVEEIKISTDDNPLYFFGHGLLSVILSPTQAILKVQQHLSPNNREYDVLIDRDIIFVNRMRCNSFEEIQGITIALRCFRMKEELYGVSYRAMAGVSAGCNVVKVLKHISVNSTIPDYILDVGKVHEGIVIGYGTDTLAIVEIKEGDGSVLVSCHKASFTSKESKEAKFIFECVSIGEKVFLKIILQVTKRYSFYTAVTVSQGSNFLSDTVCLLAKDDASNSDPVSQSKAHDLESEETNDKSLIRITKEGIELRVNAEHVFIIDHGCDLPIHSIRPLTVQKPFLPCFHGQGVLVHQISTSEAIMIVQPSQREVRFAVVIHDYDAYVNDKRCEGFDKLRGQYLKVNCIRSEMNALGISYRAISASSSGTRLPHFVKRFNIAQPKSIKLDETKVYKGEVTAFASFSCAIVEVIENNSSHLISLRTKNLLNSDKILVTCLRIGGKLDLKITTQKEVDDEIYYTAALAIHEGLGFPVGSSCRASPVQMFGEDSVSSPLAAPDTNRPRVLKDDSITNSEIVSSKENFDPWTIIPGAVENGSQVQEDQHFHDGPDKDADVTRESSTLVKSENYLNVYLSELNEVLGVVTSHKSHSEGTVLIDTLGLKVEFSINNLVWWDEPKIIEAKVLSVKDLFPLNSLLMVCAVSAPGENNFRATKVWKPSEKNFCE